MWVPAHVDIQAILATIEAMEIHLYIHEHDSTTLKKLDKRDQLMILETLGLKELCEIALLACQVTHSIITDKLLELIKEFPLILD